MYRGGGQVETFAISLNALQANMYCLAWQGYTIHTVYCGSFDLLEQVDKGTSIYLRNDHVIPG